MGELSTEAEGSVSSPFSLQEVAQPRALAEKPVAARFGVCKSVFVSRAINNSGIYGRC